MFIRSFNTIKMDWNRSKWSPWAEGSGEQRCQAHAGRFMYLQVMGLNTAYAFRSQCAEERPEEGVRTTNGVLFFRASSHLASTSKSVEGSSRLTSKTGVMCKPLLGKEKVWEKKNYLLTPRFTPFQNKCLRDEVWIISWMRCLSPLISEEVTRSALGQVSNYLTAMKRQSQLFP